MELTLGECLKIAKDHTQEVERLTELRKDAAFVVHDKGELIEEPEQSVEELTDRINELNERVRVLRQVVAYYNLNTKLDIYLDSGRQIVLAEGITLLGQLLKERGEIGKLISEPKTKRSRAPFGSATEYVSTTFDREKAQKYARTLDKEIRALRLAIDRANINTVVEVPDEIMADV